MLIIDEYITIFESVATQMCYLVVPVIAIVIVMKIIKILLIGKD